MNSIWTNKLTLNIRKGKIRDGIVEKLRSELKVSEPEASLLIPTLKHLHIIIYTLVAFWP
jgi:hypothetical protein